MAWLADPTIWAGLLTLVLLEIVLGIDNLVFVAILADRLPPHQRQRARVIGLALALLMRLALLSGVSYLMALTAPLVTLRGIELSIPDLVLLGGGLFLLWKATTELHDRVEGEPSPSRGARRAAAFWVVVLQIVALDAVFSIDSIVTAVGMVNDLPVMMLAVTIAILVMMVASGPLAAFLERHPTVVILCLGFLLMIGFSLVAQAFEVQVPKGYLYAAITFSIMIEGLNQLAQRNRRALAVGGGGRRERATAAVLRLLGPGPPEPAMATTDGSTGPVLTNRGHPAPAIFQSAEQSLVRGVLDLARRPVRSAMTPRRDVTWLDLDAPAATVRSSVLESPHRHLPVARGSLDELVGIVAVGELLQDYNRTGRFDPHAHLREALFVPETMTVLRLLDLFRRHPVPVAVVLDEYGTVEGLVSRTDIFEAIAGEFPDEAEGQGLARTADGAWLVDAGMDVRHVGEAVGRDLVSAADDYATLAGFILWEMRRLPEAGEAIERDGLRYEIVAMNGRRIDRVRIVPAAPAA